MAEQALILNEPQAAPIAAPVVTPMHMLQVAMDRGADLDKLQQLMDLQERWEANEARKAFVAAMAEFKADPPEILKTKHVEFSNTKYNHATLSDVCGAAIKGLADHGISHRWDVEQADKIKVTCVLTHRQGHSESVSISAAADTSGAKNAIQAIGSAVTYLQRYTLLAATGLAARDADDDGKDSGGNDAETITDQQAADLQALADEVKVDMPKFLKYLKVDRLEQLHVNAYRSAVSALEAKRRK